MVALLRPDHKSANAGHEAGRRAGGSDEAPPGPRPPYGAGDSGAFLDDAAADNLHRACRGDIR